MDLLTILITGVGSGIAKGILNIWLEDYNTEKEIAKNIAGILASKTDNLIAERAGTRQFEAISDKVAQNLMPLFDAVGDSLTEQEKKDVAEMAGQAVNSLKITADLLVSQSLNPKILEDALLAHSYYPNEESQSFDFSAKQKEFYKTVLSESAQYIVDIASTLPSFTEKTFAEVLTKQNSILDKADKIFDEVKRMRENNQSDDEVAAQFETKYRRAVIRRLDELQLFGVDLASTTKRYKLSVAYVTLSVEYTTTSEENELIEDSELITIDEAIQRNNRLLVRGPAGSGKTTLLQWIAVKAAGYDLKEELEDWNKCVPFFIRLREFSGKKLPKPEVFPDLITPSLSGEMPQGWVHSKLKTGQAIILIDGLDELVEKQRMEVKIWLKDLEGNFPEVRYIITTRQYAAPKGWLDKQGFMDAELQDMNVNDVSSFINHWHAAVKEGENEKEKRTELDGLEEKLIHVVKTNRNIRKLATNPLLCAMICALHRDRKTQLPTYRVGLYEACIGMFLRRDQERNVPLDDYIDIPNPQKIKLLTDFAYWLIRNGDSEVEIDKADSRFDKKLQSLKDIPEQTTGTGMRRYFVERSGILRQPTLDKIDFPHRTFEEFFAAMAAIDEGDIGVLVKHGKDDQWREVIILACGLARPSEAENIITLLVEKGDKGSKKDKAQLHLLAAACSEIAIELSKKTIEIIQDRLSKLVPPKDLKEAKLLVVGGELIVPYLKYNKTLNLNMLKPSIRTLAIIGGDLAYSVLKEYMQDDRLGIKDAIIEGCKYSANPLEYGKWFFSDNQAFMLGRAMPDEVLLTMPNLKELTIRKTFFEFSLLKGLTHLTSLEIMFTQISDFSPLSSMTGLTSLHLKYIQFSDLSSLVGLTNLTSLDLSSTDVFDLFLLSGMTNLISLNLSRTQVADLSPLVGLTNLISLNLSRTQVDDLSPLAGLTNLKSLEISHTQVTDLSPLVGLTNLNKLYIDHKMTKENSTFGELHSALPKLRVHLW